MLVRSVQETPLRFCYCDRQTFVTASGTGTAGESRETFNMLDHVRIRFVFAASKMKQTHLLVCAFLAIFVTLTAAVHPWLHPTGDAYSRAQQLLNAMNTEQKLSMVHGWSGSLSETHLLDCAFALTRTDRRAWQMVSGRYCLAICSLLWPAGIVNSCEYGSDGPEQSVKGTNVMLGPMINIIRVPQGSRN